MKNRYTRNYIFLKLKNTREHEKILKQTTQRRINQDAMVLLSNSGSWRSRQYIQNAKSNVFQSIHFQAFETEKKVQFIDAPFGGGAQTPCP